MNIIEMLLSNKPNLIYNALTRTLQPGYSFGPHSHKNVELCIMKEGECDIGVTGETVRVRSGEMMAVFPHMVHSFFMSSPRSATFLQMHFDPDSLLQVSPTIAQNLPFLRSMSDERSSYLHLRCSKDLLSCVERICREMHSPDEAFCVPLSRLYVHEMVFLLSREIGQSYRQVFNISNPLVVSAIQFINENLTGHIALSDVAAHSKVTVRHLSNVFKQEVNVTVNDYINIAKIDRAMRYLLDSSDDMTTIAFKLGFSSAQYFSTTFKKYTQVTPTEFRHLSDRDI